MEKGKNAKTIKKKRKRKVSIFTIFLWLFLITTMSTIVVSSLSQKSALVDISDDNFEIVLDMYEDNGDEKKQDITWNATSDTEEKTVTLQVTYRNADVQKRYEPGELQITLDGMESVKRSQRLYTR